MSMTSKNNIKWLQKARYKRLNTKISDKTQLLKDSNLLLLNSNIDINDLEKSDLSSYEISIIEKWYETKISGYQCMCAIFNYRHNKKIDIHEYMSQSSQISYHHLITTAHTNPGKINFQTNKPLEILSSSINFPLNCYSIASNHIYHNLFSKLPKIILKDIFIILREKSNEKKIDCLNVEQINLAIKQMKIDSNERKLYQNNQNDKENLIKLINSQKTQENDEVLDRFHENNEEEALKIQIIVELLRFHIKSIQNTSKLSKNVSESSKSVKSIDFSSFSSTIALKNDMNVDITCLKTHLITPLAKVQENSSLLTMDALEASNVVLKPYLKQLSCLKNVLSSQLDELQDNKAYLALGISKHSSEKDVKKVSVYIDPTV